MWQSNIYFVEMKWGLTLSGPGKSMHNLAITYTRLGRHQDALALKEETLRFQLRVLPKDHPDIGVQ